MALRSAPEVVGRPYVMPPGTPDEMVKVMREVLSQPKDIVDEFSKYIKFGE